MSTFLPLVIFWDVAQQSLLTSTGAIQQIKPGISYLQQKVALVTFVNGNINTPYPLTGFSTGEGNVDNQFNDPGNLCVRSDNTQCQVPGDWLGGNANPAIGQFSIRLNANTPVALSKLGTAANVSGTQLECLAFDSSGNLILSERIPFTLSNLQDTSGGSGPPVTTGRTWIDASQIDNQYAKKIGLAGETIILVSPDGSKAIEFGCNNDGTVKMNLISPYSP